MIVIENLNFRYEGFKLHGITMELKPGEMVSLLGANGAGKTTFLRCIYGVLKPHGGSIYLDGKDVLKLTDSELARYIGGVPQSHNPSFPFNSIDVVVMGRTPYMDMFSSPSEEDYKNARKILRELGISELADRPYTQISGGERQLVLIARALMQKPKVMLLDEPTAHLDIRNRVKVLSAIKEIAEKKKITVLLSIHDPNDAMRFSHRIAFMKDGRILDFGPPETVMHEKNLRDVYGMDFIILKGKGLEAVVYSVNR